MTEFHGLTGKSLPDVREQAARGAWESGKDWITSYDEQFRPLLAPLMHEGETYKVHDAAYDYHDLDADAVSGEFYQGDKVTGSFLVVGEVAIRELAGVFCGSNDTPAPPDATLRYEKWKLYIACVYLRRAFWDWNKPMSDDDRVLSEFAIQAMNEARGR